MVASESRMDEIELIHRLTARLPGNENVVIGPGDDCAVLDFGMADRLLLFKRMRSWKASTSTVR